jgi:alkylated DNA repair dioxygenase AlkB
MNGFTKINNITGAEIYEGVVFNKTEADAIEKKLIEEFPKELAKPEQAAGNKWNLKSIYYGPIDYIYGSGGSRLVRPAVSMPAWLNKTVREVEKRMGVVPGYFDTALINRYTDKNTKLGMHTDAERNLVGADGLVNPTVLTVSFGANRIFQLEGVKNFKGNNAKIETKHGSVLVMGRDSQFNYLHGIEQGTGEDGTRYSITLRHTPDINQVSKTVTSIPTEEITNFYNALTEEQKNILGNLDGLIAAYEDVPFNQSVEDYIEMLKCKL